MTTGRINQITIVYREGCGRRHCKSTGEISSYWVASTRDAPATAPSAYAIGTVFGIRFPTLSSPGHPSAALNPLGEVWFGRPRRRTQRLPSAIAASVKRDYLLLLSFRTCQRPVIHRTHSSASTGLSPWHLGAIPVRRAAGAAGFVEVDEH
ncbi:hypothetical protein NLG97_g805 [Lecanicillium saksenae]|uniref:Uncharacterized protein n=1 Tax=Lecanicillium saksenae TaxID=468837 RepID=A0ACC1R6Y0_9HYPO|nr:hypothetical protein NLG97_g805 [Lecanicillium saksenae]